LGDKIYIDALPPKSQTVFEGLRNKAFWKEFYLAGGTGLALQIAHRISVDFDLFSFQNSLLSLDREKLLRVLKGVGRIEIELSQDGTLQLFLNRVPISFFHYPFILISSTRNVGKMRIASVQDIGLMKIAALIGRGSRRDFLDLYFIVRENISLDRLFRLSEMKFTEIRDFPMQAMRALVYFEDAEKERMPKMLKPSSWKNVKEYFVREVGNLTDRFIK